jgi:hypothetical protein
MTKDNNELWVLALVDHRGAVTFEVPGDHEDIPTTWIPVTHPTLAVVSDADALSVVVRLIVRSNEDDGCEPDWTPGSPAELDGSGDAVSDCLKISRRSTRSFRIQLETSAGVANLELVMGVAASAGIDIVLRAPPVEPPSVEPSPSCQHGVQGTRAAWHARAKRLEPKRGQGHIRVAR